MGGPCRSPAVHGRPRCRMHGRAEPLVEGFDDLDFARIQTETPRHSQALNLVGLNLDTHELVWVCLATGGLSLSVSSARKIDSCRAANYRTAPGEG